MTTNFFNKIILVSTLVCLASCRTTDSSRRPEYSVTVKDGDTLSGIANKYNTTWFDILRDNQMKDARQLYIGQKLKVRPGPGGYTAQNSQNFKQRAQNDAVNNNQNGDEEAPEDQPIEPRARKGLLFGTSMGDGAGLPVKLPWPVVGSISSDFGWRWGRMHTGIDIRARRGTPIKSPAPGKVIFAARNGGYGKFVVIDHGTYRTGYAHCNTIVVKRGHWIAEGDLIGTVGSTGNSSGSHLHFEYRTARNEPKDPMPYLRSRNMISAIGIEPSFKFN